MSITNLPLSISSYTLPPPHCKHGQHMVGPLLQHTHFCVLNTGAFLSLESRQGR